MAVLNGPTPRAALVVNPKARRASHVLDRVLGAFAVHGITPHVEFTQAAGDGDRAARAASVHADHLFVLGGDGTVMEAATGLAAIGLAMPIGVLPGGTGNQLARALGIPLRPESAVKALLQGSPQPLDLAVLNGHRRVGIGAGVGLDAQMIAGAKGRLKQWLGVGSYVVTATQAALRPRRFGIRADVDGRVIEREGVIAMALNMGNVFNGLIEMAPGTSMRDGLLDLVIVDARHGLETVRFAVLEMLMKRRKDDPRWTFAQGRDIRIETVTESVPAQVDGDLIPDRVLHLEAVPSGWRLLVPAGRRII